MTNPKTKCHSCREDLVKEDGELIANRYHCKACAPKAKEDQARKDAEKSAADRENATSDEEKKAGLDIESREDRLDGMLAIARYTKRSESTILRWAQNRAFPAKCVEHCWLSSKSSIDTWWNKQPDKK